MHMNMSTLRRVKRPCGDNNNEKAANKDQRLQKENSDMKKQAIKKIEYRIIYAGHGIEIHYQKGALSENTTYLSVPWTTEERSDMLPEVQLPEQCHFETDVYHIKESTSSVPLNCVDKSHIKTTVKLKEMTDENSQCLLFKAVVRYKNEWKFLDAEFRNKTVEFTVTQMDAMFVISTPRALHHVISTNGSVFVPECDNRIQVEIPPKAVNEDVELTLKVFPIFIDRIMEKYKTSEQNDRILVAMSPCLSSSHIVFQSPIQIQLPLINIPDTFEQDEICESLVFRWNTDGAFEVTDVVPEVVDGIGHFKVKSFSSYAIAIIKKKRRQSMFNLSTLYEEATRLRMWCKILFFVCERTQHSLIVILECVEKRKLESVCKLRKQYGFHFVSEWISRDFFFEPGKKINVDVKGKFCLPKRSGLKKLQMTFFPVAEDNFTRFPVELNPKLGEEIYGVLALRDGNELLDEIYYDPWSTKKCLPNQNSKLDQKGCSSKTGKVERASSELEKDFFTDAGIMALTELINPDTLYKVVINLEMTTAQYDKICDQFQSRSMPCRQSVTLLKTALDRHKVDKKLSALIDALTISGEKRIAEYLEDIHNSGKDLSEIRKL